MQAWDLCELYLKHVNIKWHLLFELSYQWFILLRIFNCYSNIHLNCHLSRTPSLYNNILGHLKIQKLKRYFNEKHFQELLFRKKKYGFSLVQICLFISLRIAILKFILEPKKLYQILLHLIFLKKKNFLWISAVMLSYLFKDC